jgi:integrase
MKRHLEENERAKYAYATYLRHAKGQDDASIDKARAAIRRFEESTKFKPFKQFNRVQAADFKNFLNRQKNERTKRPLGFSTVDATLRLVKGFFHWLVSYPGFKRIVTYTDVEYFNNNRKAARVAHTGRDTPYPTMQQANHAFQAMPFEDEFQKRDKALFAFFMLTGIRDGAAASLKIKHVNVELGHVFQDAREVKTKAAKTIHCQFFPVDPTYRACFTEWMAYLREVKLFGPEDALFPKANTKPMPGKGFTNLGLARTGYSSGAKLNTIIRGAFAAVQMPQFTPHAFRKTLTHYGNEICKGPEAFKAWSMNLGHDSVTTTINSYLPVNTERQIEIIRDMAV